MKKTLHLPALSQHPFRNLAGVEQLGFQRKADHLLQIPDLKGQAFEIAVFLAGLHLIQAEAQQLRGPLLHLQEFARQMHFQHHLGAFLDQNHPQLPLARRRRSAGGNEAARGGISHGPGYRRDTAYSDAVGGGCA